MTITVHPDVIIERISKNQYVKHTFTRYETSYGTSETKTTQPIDESDVVKQVLYLSKKKLTPEIKTVIDEFNKNQLIVVGTNTSMTSMTSKITKSIIEICLDETNLNVIEYLVTRSDVDFDLHGNTREHTLYKLLHFDNPTPKRIKMLELLLPHIDISILNYKSWSNLWYPYFKIFVALKKVSSDGIEGYYNDSSKATKTKMINDFPATIVPMAIRNGDDNLISGEVKDIFLF